MSGKTFAFLVMIWIVGHIVCLIIQGALMGSGEVSIFKALTGFSMNSLGFLETPKAFSNALATLITWDYPEIFRGKLDIFRWIFLFPLSCAIIVAVARSFAGLVRGIRP